MPAVLRRRRAGTVLVALTALLLAATAIAGYARTEIADSRAFAARTTSALEHETFRSLVAEQVVDGVSDTLAPDALAVRPLAVAATAALLDSRAFRNALAATVRSRHAALMRGERGWALRVDPGDELTRRVARAISTQRPEFVPHDVRLPLVALDTSDFELGFARAVERIAGWWWPLLAASLLAAAACALVAGSVREAIVRLALAAAGAGAIVAALVTVAGAVVVAHASNATGLLDASERAGFAALWSALAGDLGTAGVVAAVGGVAIAAIAAGELASERLERAAAALRVATRPRLVRGLALTGAGAALLLAPGLALRVATVLALSLIHI